MNAKGMQVNSCGGLASYMMKVKPHEHVQVLEVRGFGCNEVAAGSGDTLKRWQLVQAFKNIEVMAASTKAQQPMYHGYFRLAPGEQLTDEQWLEMADRMEKRLGLENQPRGIVFHIDRETGDKHMHIGWSRIDAEKRRAIQVSFPIREMAAECDVLEEEWGLRQLDRSPKLDKPRAPTRNEFEQARRLGSKANYVRQEIRDDFDNALKHSDSGQAFVAALEDRGYELTNGTKRDGLVVVDYNGAAYPLNSRLLGLRKADIMDRLADIDRSQLRPTPEVEAEMKQARTFERELAGREQAAGAEYEQRAAQWAGIDTGFEAHRVARATKEVGRDLGKALVGVEGIAGAAARIGDSAGTMLGSALDAVSGLVTNFGRHDELEQAGKVEQPVLSRSMSDKRRQYQDDTRGAPMSETDRSRASTEGAAAPLAQQERLTQLKIEARRRAEEREREEQERGRERGDNYWRRRERDRER